MANGWLLANELDEGVLKWIKYTGGGHGGVVWGPLAGARAVRRLAMSNRKEEKDETWPHQGDPRFLPQ